MVDMKTLLFKRNTGLLWVKQRGITGILFYDVTGVERVPSTGEGYPVFVLHKGKTLGIIWDVIEIKEKW